MLKAGLVILLFLILPFITAVLLRLVRRATLLSEGYVCGCLIHLFVFLATVRIMAEKKMAPGMLPIKALVGIIALQIAAIVALVLFRIFKQKKKVDVLDILGIRQVSKIFSEKKGLSVSYLYLAVACILLIMICARYIIYVPDGALRMMADVNRIDFYGLISADASVMMGYYLKQLIGVSVSYAICLVIPSMYFATMIAILWMVADTLFAKDCSKKCFCFMAEAVLLFAGDCMYSLPQFVSHGMADSNKAMMVLVLLGGFAACLKVYVSSLQADKWIKDKKINFDVMEIANCKILALTVIMAAILDAGMLVLSLVNILIFILLFVGRRYLPWLQHSKS